MDLSKKLHPKIWESTDAYEHSLISTKKSQRTPDEKSRVRKHQKIWGRTYGRQFLARVAVAFASLGAEVVVRHTEHWLAICFAIVSVLAFVESGRFILGNRRTASPEELRNLLPDLKLSAIERVYVDAMIALAEVKTLAEATKNEIGGQLNDLPSAYLRICETRDSVLEGLGSDIANDKLIIEQHAIIERRNATNDPLIMDTLEQTVEAYDRRIANRKEVGSTVERLDAQSQLIAQTMHSVQESLTAIRLAPINVVGPDAEKISATIIDLTARSRSIEDAVQEVKVLGHP